MLSRLYPELLVAIVTLDLKTLSFFAYNFHVFPFFSTFLRHICTIDYLTQMSAVCRKMSQLA